MIFFLAKRPLCHGESGQSLQLLRSVVRPRQSADPGVSAAKTLVELLPCLGILGPNKTLNG